MIINQRRVALIKQGDDLQAAITESLNLCGILPRISSSTRVALKPNLTYPFYKKGVTTSPEVVRATVAVLKEFTKHITIVESDGGYGAWRAEEAFAGHGFYKLRDELNVELANLCQEGRELITFRSQGREYQLPLPSRLLHHTDLFITMPVPKIHCMTGLTLSYKNQWGCIPDNMRLRRHYIFDDAIVAINKALKPVVLADGTYFLDRNGPMDGEPIPMQLIIAATDAGAFDRYVADLMGFPWHQVSHLRQAHKSGDLPAQLDEISYNVSPVDARTHVFRLERSPRNWIALAGFKSRFLTWLGYEAWFGRVVLHGLLYAVVGKPVQPRSEQ